MSTSVTDPANTSASVTDPVEIKQRGIPARRRVERAIARAYGQSVAEVLQALAGRSLEELRVELSRALGDPVHESAQGPLRVEAGGRRVVDGAADFQRARVQVGDCLVLAADGVPRPIVALAGGQLLLDPEHQIPRSKRQLDAGYRIVRPWQLSEWAVRCLCRRYGLRPVRADHWRARNRGRHQQAVQRVFRLPFARYTENLLFAAEGVDSPRFGLAIRRQGPGRGRRRS